jgi:DNA-binding IclR family transcriptional regulator
MSEPIPDDLGQLLRERVASLEGLEVVLLLRRDPDRSWPADELAERLSIPESLLDPVLVELAQQGLLATSDQRWRYAPASAELAASIDRLALLYDERRLEVMRLLSAHALERIRNSAARAFADAFVIKRKKDG